MLIPKHMRGASAAILALSLSSAAHAQQTLPTIEVGKQTQSDGSPAQRNIAQRQRAPAPAPTVAAPSASNAAPGVQNTTAGPVQGYHAFTSRATRLETPLQQLPMSVQVIPRKLIDDQRAISQSEVFRNVSGVVPVDPLFPGGANLKVRGMDAERYLDGLPNYWDFGVRDLLSNVERVEVLKGPANILFQGGQSPVGGVVNIVSKLPTSERFAQVSVMGGGYRYGATWIDVNQPLTADNRSVLFRVTGMYETTHAVVETLHRQSYTVNPTLKIAPDDATSLIIQGHLNRREQQDYTGLPAVGSVDTTAYTIKRTAFLANPNLPNTRQESSGVTLRFEHQFDETFSVNAAARWNSSHVYNPSQLILGNTPTNIDTGAGIYGGPTQFYVVNAALNQRANEFTTSGNVVAKFDFGPTQNRLLVGGDFNRVWDRGQHIGSNATGPDPVFGAFGFPALIDFRAPVFPPFVVPYPGADGFAYFSKINNVYQNAGVTTQLQTTVFERLHVLAALRYAMATLHAEEDAITPPKRFDTDDAKLLPRVGGTFDLTRNIAVFGDYSEGMRLEPFFLGGNNQRPRPNETKQWEVGLKFDDVYGLSGTLAYFNLTRNNVVVPIAGTVLSRQAGEHRSEGFEADLVWQPMENLSFLASFAHIHAKVTKDDNVTIINSRLTGVPINSGRLWGNYSFDGQLMNGVLKGWSFGAGFYAASGQQIELGTPWASASYIGTPWFTRGYITYDANLAYKHENFTFAITAKNIGDRQYFLQYPYFSGRVQPGDGRTIFATVSVKM